MNLKTKTGNSHRDILGGKMENDKTGNRPRKITVIPFSVDADLLLFLFTCNILIFVVTPKSKREDTKYKDLFC